MAGTVAFEIVPVVLLGFVAGAVVDRYPRRRVMLIADLARAGVAVGLVLFHEQLAVVYLAAFLLSGFSVFFNPAAASVLPALVPEDQVVTANSAIWSAAVISQIALAPVAGALVAVAGPGPAFAVNAATFLASAAFVARHPQHRPRDGVAEDDSGQGAAVGHPGVPGPVAAIARGTSRSTNGASMVAKGLTRHCIPQVAISRGPLLTLGRQDLVVVVVGLQVHPQLVPRRPSAGGAGWAGGLTAVVLIGRHHRGRNARPAGNDQPGEWAGKVIPLDELAELLARSGMIVGVERPASPSIRGGRKRGSHGGSQGSERGRLWAQGRQERRLPEWR